VAYEQVLALLAVLPAAVAFAVAYQDWLLPGRRRIGYEEMRRSVREVKNSGPPRD
jgi:hypothetical protein